MSMSKPFFASLSALIASAVLVPGTGHALDRTTSIAPAAGPCQVSDSSYAASFKVRALSSDNVGSGAIYVICGLPATKELAAVSFKIGLRNQGTSQAASITCTAVTGTTTTPPTYYPKTAVVPAGTESQIEWTASDDAGSNTFPKPISITCALPSQTGIMTTELVTLTQIN